VGRKTVVFLTVIGDALAVAWKLAVLRLKGNSIGGGNTVLLANLYSTASDSVAQQDRYSPAHTDLTASAFFLAAFSSLVGASFDPALSSKLMETFSPWIVTLPNCFNPVVIRTRNTVYTDSNSADFTDNVDSEESRPNTIMFHLSQSLQLICSLTSLLCSSTILVFTTFLTVAPEALGSSQFMAQYISKRFGYPIAKTGYLETLRGFIHMAVLLFILPLLSNLLCDIVIQPSTICYSHVHQLHSQLSGHFAWRHHIWEL
ncbi:hypothetical protein N7467_009967, partial [Penicillium canescens]